MVFRVNLCSNRGCVDFGDFEIGFVLRTFGVFFCFRGRFWTRIDTKRLFAESDCVVVPTTAKRGGRRERGTFSLIIDD